MSKKLPAMKSRGLTELVSVYVHPKVKKQLIKYVDKHDMTISALLRVLIDAHIENQKV